MKVHMKPKAIMRFSQRGQFELHPAVRKGGDLWMDSSLYQEMIAMVLFSNSVHFSYLAE